MRPRHSSPASTVCAPGCGNRALQLARLEGVKTLSVAEIQKHLLDTDTLLLVYSLGERRSVLWRVTRSTLASHQLPGRERIEAAARLVRALLSQRPRPGSNRRQKTVDDLAALVLKPVAADLPKYRRLLIVADGALQFVPFAALPDPAAAPAAGRQPFLVESHSIIMLPSASVGASLRQERRTGPHHPPGPLIAVLADPVFEASDPRVQSESARLQPKDEPARGQLTRSLRDLGLSELDRLPFSRQEAEAIQSLWRPGEVMSVVGFAASRDVLDGEAWRRAPILHFATHSLLDDRQPELLRARLFPGRPGRRAAAQEFSAAARNLQPRPRRGSGGVERLPNWDRKGDAGRRTARNDLGFHVHRRAPARSEPLEGGRSSHGRADEPLLPAALRWPAAAGSAAARPEVDAGRSRLGRSLSLGWFHLPRKLRQKAGWWHRGYRLGRE